MATNIDRDDVLVHQAIGEIYATYGDRVSVENRHKSERKFGINAVVGTSAATLATLGAGELHETFVASDLITAISSSDTGDVMPITITGHTLSGTSFTLVEQTVTLTAQTKATLATPLARVQRAYNSGATPLVGAIYIYEDMTPTAGVPQTATGVHATIRAGRQQTEKAAMTLSSTEYFIMTSFWADALKKTAGFADVQVQVRLYGKVFRQQISISATTGGRGTHQFNPYLIVPKNADVRLVGTADASTTPVSGGFQGFYARVIG